MERRWVLKQRGNETHIRHLAEAININKHLSNLLVQRGITTFEQAKTFFRPELSQLHDPFLMKDMDKAIQRIEQSIASKEKILVYGDYDVDGTSAVALVYTFLQSLYDQLDFYIPDRYAEGYGISYQGIDYASDNGISLIIALDCGIKAVEKIKYANEKGIDFIICDHHRPGETLPAAVAVLDPKRADCHYPFNELSGCGVGFKLIQAIAQKRNIPFSKLECFLDLVVVSIASDIVSITGENRILAHFGLKLINTQPRPGIEAILKYSGINRKADGMLPANIFSRELTISDLVFLVGPRINAAGRIESGKNSVRLLICKTMQDAETYATQINDCNNERKNLDTQTTQDALEMISLNPDLIKAKATVLYNPDWHKGIIGIVASRLTDSYYRPTIILTRSNHLITGSARSVKDFDIYDAIDACSDLLEHFGGHKYAAGLSLKPENLEPFRKRFEEIVDATIKPEMLIPEIEIDSKLNLSDINSKFIQILKQFAPFGPGNMTPIFQTDGVVDTGYARIVGKNHVKLSVIHPEISGYPCSAIAFQQGDFFPQIGTEQPFDICYHIEENEWNGQKEIQLNIKDIQLSAKNSAEL
ncbi:MAG: single-stranded-DNA-specific exonuclease RecJ [Lentimicrobiaceae bacterium]|nr:single-stranded-DNA-specific exonuclease RecJ [Lentimicrobiaceae bacterium]